MKQAWAILLIVLVVGGGYLLATQMKRGEVSPVEEVASDTQSTIQTSPSSESIETYTLAQVSEHDSKDSCWLAIEGKVYDVSEFVASGFHPGKDAILQGCGTDASALFNERPNGSGAHSARARSMLPKYYIGELVN